MEKTWRKHGEKEKPESDKKKKAKSMKEKFRTGLVAI
jgi:hypothetical protein